MSSSFCKTASTSEVKPVRSKKSANGIRRSLIAGISEKASFHSSKAAVFHSVNAESDSALFQSQKVSQYL